MYFNFIFVLNKMIMSEINKTMKAWQLHEFGLDNLTLDNVATPEPKAHEILIKVGAVSLNFRDKANL